MKELLQPFHFVAEKEPTLEDFRCSEFDDGAEEVIFDMVANAYYNKKGFRKALQDWKRKYEKPEPRWISFEEQCPKFNQEILFTKKQSHHIISHRWKGDEENMLFWLDEHKWHDKKSYDKRLEEWEYHQVKFEGFKKGTELEDSFYNDSVEIYWDDNGVHISSDNMSYWNQKGVTVSQFESITRLKRIR